MTKETRSEIMTKKTRSRIGREVSAYFAPNYHLCQNYTESGSFLTVHKNIKTSIHKNEQTSRIVESNRYNPTAKVTLELLSVLHPRQATFYTYTKGTK